MYCVCHVVFQTDGATPLFIASQNGHVECVQALLSGGAAINQATVGCASSRARHFVVLGACDRACADFCVLWDVMQERWLSPCSVFVGMGLGDIIIVIIIGCNTCCTSVEARQVCVVRVGCVLCCIAE